MKFFCSYINVIGIFLSLLVNTTNSSVIVDIDSAVETYDVQSFQAMNKAISNFNTQSSCTAKCPIDYIPSNGSCKSCTAGSGSPCGGTKCMSCPSGKYNAVGSCPPETTTTTTRATSSNACVTIPGLLPSSLPSPIPTNAPMKSVSPTTMNPVRRISAHPLYISTHVHE